MQAIREEDRVKAAVLVAATVGIFGFIGFQIYGATKPAGGTTVSANRTVTQGEAQTVNTGTAPGGPAPSGPGPTSTPAPGTSVSVSGVAPNRVDPFRAVLAGPNTGRLPGGVRPPAPKPGPLPGAGDNGTTATVPGGGTQPVLPPTGPNIASIAPVYKGSMLGNRRAAVLTINGRDVIINEGDARDGVRVVKVNRDSVAIRLAGSKEVIILKTAA